MKCNKRDQCTDDVSQYLTVFITIAVESQYRIVLMKDWIKIILINHQDDHDSFKKV